MKGKSIVDLRGAFGPVRDQGLRPTCLVFAASAVHEHARNHSNALSPEALYASAKKRDGLPAGGGTTVSATATAVEEDGQCDEAAWPYGDSVASDADATYYHARIDSRERSDLVDRVCGSLDVGIASIVVLTVTDSWSGVGLDGLIPVPGVADRIEGRHAVVAVGYDDAQLLLIVRNSWGVGWGSDGYALMPYEYLELYGLEVITLEAIPGPITT